MFQFLAVQADIVQFYACIDLAFLGFGQETGEGRIHRCGAFDRQALILDDVGDEFFDEGKICLVDFGIGIDLRIFEVVQWREVARDRIDTRAP